MAITLTRTAKFVTQTEDLYKGTAGSPTSIGGAGGASSIPTLQQVVDKEGIVDSTGIIFKNAANDTVKLYLDVDGNLRIEGSLVAESEVSAWAEGASQPATVWDALGSHVDDVTIEYVGGELKVKGSGGVSTFDALTDTPNTKVADKWLKVNAGGTALEYTDAPTTSTPNLQAVTDISNITTKNVITQSGSAKALIGYATGEGGYLQAVSDTGAFSATIRSYAINGVQAHFTAGYVGIGTTNAIGPLHIHSGDGLSRLAITDDVTTDALSRGLHIGLNSNQAPFIWNYENTPMSFANNNTTYMTALSDGKVGINTATPASKLHSYFGQGTNPADGATFGSNSGYIRFRNNAGSAYSPTIEGYTATATSSPMFFISQIPTSGTGKSFGFSARQSGGTVIPDANRAFTVLNYETDLFTILGDGKVGIGTTSPSYGLHVSYGGDGSIAARFDNGDADYVDIRDYGIDIFRANAYLSCTSSNGNLVLRTNNGSVDNTRILIDGGTNNISFYSHDGVVHSTIQPVSGNYGSFQIDGNAVGGYEGYSIGGRVVFMHDGITTVGLFDDVNNNWILLHTLNGQTSMYHNGIKKISTHVGGAQINGATSTTYALEVSGTVNATDLRATSDRRKKKSISFISDANTILSSLNGVRYNWRKGFSDDSSRKLGFIAQDVEKIMPEAVMKDNDGYYGLSYNSFAPILVEGWKSHNNEILKHKNIIKNLNDRIDRLERSSNVVS